MKTRTHKYFLLIGITGVVIGIAGNFMKKYDVSLGKPAHIVGIAGMAIFWLYSVWDVLKSKFWTTETKIKYSLLVILLPIIGPFIYYYFKKDVVVYDNTNT